MQLDLSFILTALQSILPALPMTFLIAFVPLLLGSIIGIIVALVRLSGWKISKALLNFYVSFYRGTPVILHIFLIYFGMPIISDEWFDISLNGWPIVIFVIIALTLNAGAFLSEIIRSGIMSVTNHQIDAAISLGMTTFQVYWRIILPQAFVVVIPNLTNIIIAFLHASSIAFLVSVKEITGAANIIASSNLKYLESFIAVGIVYWVITILIEVLANQLEKKLTAHVRQGVVQAL
ncbi:amino acid ABC transporter permease [Peribacillus psychrosaccharolyticus]|uniref:amino acid ABC transporter permease n=1 Tax=Peribacillus psychrosaccharolyticus TaxID=1407 RepID=UPI003D2AE51D